MIEAQMNRAEAALNVAQDAVERMQTEVNRGPGGRELSLAITKIEEGMLWLAAFNKTQEKAR